MFIRFLFVCVFASISLNAYSIGKPDLIKPSSDQVSLRSEFVVRNVPNAVSYEFKLRRIEPSTGLSTTVEKEIVTGTNKHRFDTELTDGDYYKLIIRAIDGLGTKSERVHFYFQAKEKCLIIGHAQLHNNGVTNQTYDRLETDLASSTEAKSTLWVSGVSFSLPDGAIITGLKVQMIDNTSSDSEIYLARSAFGEADNIPNQLGNRVSSNNTSESSREFSKTYAEEDDMIIDNDNYHYQVNVVLAKNHKIERIKITYVD